MGYAKLDDRLPHHRKVREIAPKLVVAAYGLYVASVQFAQRDETDGRIREPDLLVILPTAPRPQLRTLTVELVRVHLWDDHAQGGWSIHDYLEWNLSAEEREQQRRGTNTRVNRYRDRLRTAARNGVSNAVGNAVTNEPVTSTTPLLSSPLHSSPLQVHKRYSRTGSRPEGSEGTGLRELQAQETQAHREGFQALLREVSERVGLPPPEPS